jgi:ribosomal protein S18 acetylase RimI-like enzyme
LTNCCIDINIIGKLRRKAGGVIVKIRKADIRDIDAVTAVESASFPKAEAAKRTDFEQRLTIFPNHFWVLEADGKVVSLVNGMITNEPQKHDELLENPQLHNENGEWLIIFGVATDPSYRKCGYAKALMNKVLEDTKAENRRGAVLICKDELIAFYEQFGFVYEGVSKSEHGGVKWNNMKLTF